jgi:MSHA biogenesis protein MshJ
MKQYWQKFSTRIDALSLRERVIIFMLAAVVLLTLVNSLLLESQFAHQKQIAQQIQQEQSQIAGLQTEIQQVVQRHNVDPDKQNRARLEQLTQQLSQMEGSLRGLQRGLISPGQISVVLEEILQKNGKLHLVSLKTLPATSLIGQAQEDGKTAARSPASGRQQQDADRTGSRPVADALYKHGVEITVRGSYLEMLNYLKALEAMPWQLFWGSVKLNVDEHPTSTLTLTLFTLSLEKKWLNL